MAVIKFKTFQVPVPTSGTPVNFPKNQVNKSSVIMIKAPDANTGNITVGFTSVTAFKTSTAHFVLEPGTEMALDNVVNTNLIWIDATVSAELVHVAIG